MASTVLRRLFALLRAHPTPETLATRICAELPALRSWRVRRHLAGCQTCRERKEDLDGPLVAAMLAAYRDATAVPEELPQAPRDAFAQWLAAQPVPPDLCQPKGMHPSGGAHSSRLRLVAMFFSRWPATFYSSPAGAVALVILLAGAASLPWWPRRSAPQMSPEALLLRAEKLELDGLRSVPTSGAVRQTVLIKVGPYARKCSLYWDPRGRRRAKIVDWTRDNDPLGSAAAAAGLDWNRPVSASAYQAWRQRQRLSADSVTRSAHLLTLTTTVADGVVAAESLTLRNSDFHAVARTVEVRGRGTVAIAELDYTVLPWSAVPATAFEPLEPLAGSSESGHTVSLPAVSLPALPDADQLDASELAARLILSQLHADVGEQIAIRRTPQWVEVSGLIEEDERKRQLRGFKPGALDKSFDCGRKRAEERTPCRRHDHHRVRRSDARSSLRPRDLPVGARTGR